MKHFQIKLKNDFILIETNKYINTYSKKLFNLLLCLKSVGNEPNERKKLIDECDFNTFQSPSVVFY